MRKLTFKPLWNAIETEIGYNEIDEKVIKALRQNIFYFSAAKTYQQLKDISNLLVGEDGKRRSFQEFKKEVSKLNTQYNYNYLQAEYNFATSSAQVVSRWYDLTEGDTTALITYDAVGDLHTTQLCNHLDGVTLPANDKFWNKYTPPNHWNCRSTLRRGYEIKKPAELPKIEDEFAFNPATSQQIFSDKHPYLDKFPKSEKKNIKQDADLAFLENKGVKRLVASDGDFAPDDDKFFALMGEKLKGFDLANLVQQIDLASKKFSINWDNRLVEVYENDVQNRLMKLSFTGNYKNKRVVLDRSIFIENNKLFATHDSFILPEEAQGKGFSKAIIKEFIKQYQATGVEKIVLYANKEVGGYVWAKYGFVATDKPQIITIINRAFRDDKITEKEKEVILKIVESDFEEFGYLRMQYIAKLPVGKKILEGQNWDGELNLNNPSQFKSLMDYLNKK